jgi:exoribonuclease-2
MGEIEREGALADSLVLYKGRPARVLRVGKKLQIELEGEEILKVRPKDIILLHPGPLGDLGELASQDGEMMTAWELLAGSGTNLLELAELAYGQYTPVTAWAAWQWVADGLYFEGTPQALVAHSREEVRREQASRAAKAAEEEAWTEFLRRLHAGKVRAEDQAHLREVEDLALGRSTRSRILKELGRNEDPESAHALLLELGYWDATVDPYPVRLGLVTVPPSASLPALPEEPRVDLTHLVALAIDDEGNRDPDDALSLDGNRLWVHIADVAALVKPDSEADLEARSRGASLYLPEGTVPMLPSPAVASLGLGLAEISPALSFGLDLDADARVRGVDVVRSWVQVTRLTYEEAEARLGQEPLTSLYELAERNRERREKRGAVSLDLPEVKVFLEQGEVFIRPILPRKSRDLVTEAMLMAGEGVAQFAAGLGIAIPYTTQDPPLIEDRPQDLAGMNDLRRAMRASEPSSIPGPHAGLGLEAYAQTTSPLRRYLDLVVHQQLRACLRGDSLLTAAEVLERVGETAAVTGSVRQAERLARKHWTLVYLQRHPGWQGDGVLVYKRGLRGTVLIPSLDLDVQVHLRKAQPLNSLVAVEVVEVNLPALDVWARVAT